MVVRTINYSFNVEKFVKNEVQSLNKCKKQIVYRAKNIGIQSLFVSIEYKIYQIVTCSQIGRVNALLEKVNCLHLIIEIEMYT